MTAELPTELLDAIRSARACMADIRALAEKLGDLSHGQIESALQGFPETREDRALSRLLQVCAFNDVKLEFEVLCACIGVCEGILDSAPCFALQDDRVIEPLLRSATAEASSIFAASCHGRASCITHPVASSTGRRPPASATLLLLRYVRR